MIHKTYIICIGGFTQGIGRRTGIFRLWMKLLKLRSPHVSVELYEYNHPWNAVAEQIFLASEDWDNTRIVVAAYSFGGGFGFLQLARELAERGLEIDTGILSDAVYRSRFILGKWLAFVDWPVIRVPPNVKIVHWFYQRMNRPRGHRVVAVNEQSTKIDPPEGTQLSAIHQFLDDSPVFHKLVISVAEKAVVDSVIEQAVTEKTVAQQERRES